MRAEYEKRPEGAALAKYKPQRIVVIDRDGNETPINRSTGPRPWRAVLRALDQIDPPWVMLKFFDARGGYLGKHSRSPDDPALVPPSELEALDTPASAGGGGELATAIAVNQLMLRSQEIALARQVAQLQPVLDAQLNLVQHVIGLLGGLISNYSDALSTIHHLAGESTAANIKAQLAEAAAQVQAAGGDVTSDDLLTKMMPVFVQAALGGGKHLPAPAPAPKNGARNGAGAKNGANGHADHAGGDVAAGD
jgi:hypothetical protein